MNTKPANYFKPLQIYKRQNIQTNLEIILLSLLRMSSYMYIANGNVLNIAYLLFVLCRYLYPFELHEKETLKPSVKEEVSERSSHDKKIKPESPDSPPDSSDEKHLECLEPSLDIDEDHEEVIVKKQSTRIKEMKRQQSRDLENSMLGESPTKSPEEDVSVDVVNSPESSSDVSEPQSDSKSDIPVDENTFEIGDKIQVKYGRGRNHRLYDAKVRYSLVKSQ